MHRILAATAFGLASVLPAQTQLYFFGGAVNGDQAGMEVAILGDVNADGWDDVVMGAPGEAGTGVIRVFSGVDGSVLHQKFGDAIGHEFGRRVAAVGDVNADGFADFAGSSGFVSPGYVRVYSGADGAQLFEYTSSDVFGSSVAGAGDVDGDGFDDVIVGTSLASLARVLAGPDGSTLHTFVGEFANDGFGRDVAGAGDVDGDGFDDLLVGALFVIPGNGYVQVRSGADGSLLYRYQNGDPGSPAMVTPEIGSAVAGVGDVNGDGFADFAFGDPGAGAGQEGAMSVLSGADGSELFAPVGTATFGAFGHAVDGGGDLNGDSVPDIAVSQPSIGLSSVPGTVYVYSGADFSLLSTIPGTANWDTFGTSISIGGDVDNDGFDDVAVGVPFRVTQGAPGNARVYDLDFVGTPSREIEHGVGCPLTGPRTPRTYAIGRGFIDQTVTVALRGGPAFGTASLLVGLPVALPLDILGMVGCSLYVDPWFDVPLPLDADGRAAVDLTFPDDPNMIGVLFENQWAVPDVTAPFPLPLTMANALTVVIGG